MNNAVKLLYLSLGADGTRKFRPIYFQRQLEFGGSPRKHRQQTARVRADRFDRRPGGDRPQDEGVHLSVELHSVRLLRFDHSNNYR